MTQPPPPPREASSARLISVVSEIDDPTPVVPPTDPSLGAELEEQALFAEAQEQQAEAGAASLEDEIRAAAYQRYLRRGSGAGDAESDWLEAEAELKARAARRNPEVR